MWFEAISSLKINMVKGELSHIEEGTNVGGLALVLGWKVGNLPTEYLGLLLVAPHKFGRA